MSTDDTTAEEERLATYNQALADGLSDHEARAEGWPEEAHPTEGDNRD
jgi:hypothetical protein